MADTDRVLTINYETGELVGKSKEALDKLYVPVATAAVDPAVFGALADGTTDDSAAIRAAFAKAGPNGVVRLRPGKTYATGSLITLPAGATLEAYGATLRAKDGSAAFNLLTFGAGGGTVRGLTVDLNKANTTNSGSPIVGVGIYISSGGWQKVDLVDVRVVNGWQYGIYFTNFNGLTDAALAAVHPTTFTNVVVDGCGYGMGFGKFGGLTLINCSAINSTLGSNVYMSLMREPNVLGGRFTGSLAGSGLFFDYVYKPLITNPQCDNNKAHGLVMGGGVAANASSREFVVIGGSYCNNDDCGITCDPTKFGAANVWQRQDGRLIGVHVQNNGRAGIQLENSGYVGIVGGDVKNNGRIAPTVGFGIRATGAYFTIDAVTIVGNSQAGVGLLGSTATPDVGHHRIGVNLFQGNAGGTYFLGETLTDTKFAALTTAKPE